MKWERSHRFDRRALPLADRHYTRQKPGTPQFVPPGRCFVGYTKKGLRVIQLLPHDMPPARPPAGVLDIRDWVAA